MEKKKIKNNRNLWFRCLKTFMKIFIHKPKYIYVGDKIQDGSLIISNHVGTSAPLALELYLNQPIRFWGAYEMNASLAKLYKYQTRVYYHEKKHWNLFGARIFCLLASPLTWIFYRGLRLISTYPDYRLKTTIKESIDAIRNNESVVIFPEDSSEGYLDKLKGLFCGFALLARTCYKQGIDLSIHCAYYRKSDKTYIFDTPIKYSELVKKYHTQEELATALCNRINELPDTY